jgi:hypothetical protein
MIRDKRPKGSMRIIDLVDDAIASAAPEARLATVRRRDYPFAAFHRGFSTGSTPLDYVRDGSRIA